MVCKGRGVCSFSGKPHQILSGTNQHGFLTALKNAYPDKLCNAIMRSLKDSILRQRASVRWHQLRFGQQYNA